MALKYTAKQVINRALNLADLSNSSFLSYEEQTDYLNDAYRSVYQDAINAGEEYYLKSYRLEGDGSRCYDLPDDCYQIVAITTDNGVALNRKDPRDSEDSPGYEIVNNTLYLSKCTGGAVLKYYPVPETITYKADEKEVTIPEDFSPCSGYGTKVISEDGKIYDISTGEWVKDTTELPSFPTVMGKYTFIQYDSVHNAFYEYDFEHNALESYSHPLLLENGSFADYADGSFGVASLNNTGFIFKDGKIFYFNGEEETEIFVYGIDYNAHYVYFDGKDAIVLSTGKIVFQDGSYCNLDQEGFISNQILLKEDLNTGYGFLVKKGNKWFLNGWLPDTKIDYPNNILFSIVCYKLAISYRAKQNADTTALEHEAEKLIKTYASSLSVDGQSYPTIRNHYSNVGWY